MSDEPVYVRIIYEVGTERRFWTRQDALVIDASGMIEAMNIETGQRKVLGPATGWTLTEDVELPMDVKQTVEDCEVLADE